MDYKGASVMLIEFAGFSFCLAVDEEWRFVSPLLWMKARLHQANHKRESHVMPAAFLSECNISVAKNPFGNDKAFGE